MMETMSVIGRMRTRTSSPKVDVRAVARKRLSRTFAAAESGSCIFGGYAETLSQLRTRPDDAICFGCRGPGTWGKLPGRHCLSVLNQIGIGH